VLGPSQTYPRAIRPALQAVGALPGATVAGIYMMVLQQGVYFFADCTVNIEPDAETLAEIGASTADFVQGLGLEARVAMLSFSNFGSARHPRQARVADAVTRLQARRPDLMVDGEMQADTAVVEEMLNGSYPFSKLQRPANVLIFPDLNAANICYKLLERLGGAQAIGPILVGMAAPIHVLQHGARADTIVNLAVIAAVDALERRRHRATPTPT
jgi:malate dehydrogenase (oxaloacetate-decarboxylating)(NADP+)